MGHNYLREPGEAIKTNRGTAFFNTRTYLRKEGKVAPFFFPTGTITPMLASSEYFLLLSEEKNWDVLDHLFPPLPLTRLSVFVEWTRMFTRSQLSFLSLPQRYTLSFFFPFFFLQGSPFSVPPPKWEHSIPPRDNIHGPFPARGRPPFAAPYGHCASSAPIANDSEIVVSPPPFPFFFSKGKFNFQTTKDKRFFNSSSPPVSCKATHL